MSPKNGAHGDGPGVVPIQAVERAAAMLALFSPAEPELTLAEIIARLGMSRATVHRYGMSLRSTGLLRYDAVRGTYSLGPRVIELGRTALANLSIIKIATPALERLSEASNETAVLSIWDGTAPIVVNVVDRTDRLVSIAIRTGSRLPLRTSAQGHVFLAYSAVAREVDARHAGAGRVPERRLQEVRDAGMATSDGVIAGITVVAAPVMQQGEIAGTIGLVCQQESGVGEPRSPAIELLRRAAQDVGEQLGEHD
ncbi:MAG: yiaJ 2 [Solirubrobacterales bacterium]|nr:yiaJ 2 [Solirubrobacterales bacterium]